MFFFSLKNKIIYKLNKVHDDNKRMEFLKMLSKMILFFIKKLKKL